MKAALATVEPSYPPAMDVSEVSRDIAESGLAPRGTERALGLVKSVSQRVRECEIVAAGTEDKSCVIEFVRSSSDRELDFVVPDDGSVVYFIARATDFRKAGIVREESAIAGLTDWFGEDAAFSDRGLEVG